MATATLIDFTGKGRPDEARHAANMLVFTKSTRLNISPGLLAEIQGWPAEKLAEELAYMATTIPSSWEFVTLTFLLTDVTRAAAQQITRTRTASYAMQSLRVVDASGIGILNPYKVGRAQSVFAAAADTCKRAYSRLIEECESSAGDARGILPMNTHSNLLMTCNLRSFVDLVQARKSLRTQGEYVDLVRQMHAQVIATWPWAAPFFESKFDAAIEMLEAVIKDIGLTTGSGNGWQIAKAIDLLRKAK